MTRTEITVRPVEPSDLDAIVRIDEKLSGHPRKEYWQRRLEMSLLRPPWMSRVAETDGRVVGFLFGWVGESEFGIAAATAWIDLIGVDPAYRGRGVGQALMDRFVSSGRELRAIAKVATLIDLTQADVREFFVRQGFVLGRMIQLERDVAGGQP
jgi:ribosomal protein S18 acetylase RimI-like enzyme